MPPQRTRRCSSTWTARRTARGSPTRISRVKSWNSSRPAKASTREADIKEAARAFTGWSVNRETGEYLFRPGAHDYGYKTVLGQSGRFDGDAVLDILLAQPSTAEFITAKLWREFVSPDPDPREVKRIAQAFRSSNYDIRTALRGVLLSDAFWARDNRGTLVKSPIEFVVGTLRQLEIPPPNGLPFAVLAAGMGQNLFSPPNVKGWPGGNAWIDANTLLARKQFVDRLARADEAIAADDRGRVAAIAVRRAHACSDAALRCRRRKGALPEVGSRSRSRGAQRGFRRRGVARRAQRRHARRQGTCGAGAAARVAAANGADSPATTRSPSSARRCRTRLSTEVTATNRTDPAMNRRTFLRSAAALPVAARHRRQRLHVFGSAQVAIAAAPAWRQLQPRSRPGRAERRQRRPQHARSVHRSRLLLVAPEDRHQARRRRAIVGPRRTASFARSLLPLWRESQLAILQGVGYPDPNLSHFRSIEIWDTASNSAEYLQDGWLTRAFAARPAPRGFAADGVIIGSGDLGPLAGGGTRAIALANTEQFLRRAKLAQPTPIAGNPALAHVLKVGVGHRAGRRASRCAIQIQRRNFRRAISATRSTPRARSSPIRPASPSCG